MSGEWTDKLAMELMGGRGRYRQQILRVINLKFISSAPRNLVDVDLAYVAESELDAELEWRLAAAAALLVWCANASKP